jgi:zinc transport system substrate-binding protein
MRRVLCFLLLISLVSCGRQKKDSGEKLITVSIAPFKYFVEAVAGDEYNVNVMVPPGANPHIYEPFPEQINKLRRSLAYISNGYLGFEMTWLDRFYETNRTMKRLSLGDKIDPLTSGHHHGDNKEEGADPHYWVSPKCALLMASEVRDFLIDLNPSQKEKYETNYKALNLKLIGLDTKSKQLFSDIPKKSFMIFHPNLGYLARDYGLEEISVEYEGKEPTPSRMKELIDRARKEGLRTIFVQREYDTKNAKAIANEIGGDIRIIDPLSEDWPGATLDIINAVHNSLTESSK